VERHQLAGQDHRGKLEDRQLAVTDHLRIVGRPRRRPWATMPSMAIDFEAEGLLKGLRGRAREARRELLEQLAADGVSLEELRRTVEEDRLVLLPLERVLDGGGPRYTAEEVAERAGVDVEFLLRQRRALGLPTPGPDERVFAEDDVAATRRLASIREILPDEGLLESARVLGLAMSQFAAANRALIAEAMVQAGDTERDAGLRLAEAARRLGPQVGEILEYAFNLHLREQIRHDVIGGAQLRRGAPGTQEITACFVDMVGFTSLGEELPPEELGSVTGRLGQLAAEIVRPPVRLVKLIGDAAMLVSPDSEQVVDAALSLVEAAEAEGESFPMLRAGLGRGTAIARAGDWYGRPVNLASRITEIARPGSVLASAAVVDAVGDGFRYSFAGERRLRGIQDRVELFRVRRGARSGGS
jgi:adenylate cyclase